MSVARFERIRLSEGKNLLILGYSIIYVIKIFLEKIGAGECDGLTENGGRLVVSYILNRNEDHDISHKMFKHYMTALAVGVGGHVVPDEIGSAVVVDSEFRVAERLLLLNSVRIVLETVEGHFGVVGIIEKVAGSAFLQIVVF